MPPFAKRLELIIKALNHTRNSFIAEMGYKNNSIIYDYTSEKEGASKPGIEFIERMVQVFPGINLRFLFTGEGTPLEEKHTAATNSTEAAVKEVITSLTATISRLTEANFVANQTIAQLVSREAVKQG
jgi:hypothetical protein